jgi:hypothetical protein
MEALVERDHPEDMTPEERERFERDTIHHEREEQPDGGPASEPDVRPDQPDPPNTSVFR